MAGVFFCFLFLGSFGTFSNEAVGGGNVQFELIVRPNSSLATHSLLEI
jgi:hypothetical protein